MNIAIIIERFDPDAGGAERSTAEIAAEMQARGHRVTVLSGRGGLSRTGAVGADGANAIRRCPLGMPRGVLRVIYFRRWVRRQLASGEFDASLSVTSTVPADLVEPRAGLIVDIQERSSAWRHSPLSRLLGRKAQELNPRRIALRLLEERTMRDPSVKYFVGISRMMQVRMQHHFPEVHDQVVEIPNAVKPMPVKPDQLAAWRSEFRSSWKIEDGETLFLCPVLDSRRKGLTPLLRSLSLLFKQHPETRARLILAGRIHPSHRRLIRCLKLSSRVHDVGFHKDLRPLYAAADVTVLPTYYDSFGRVAIESMLLGRPAITTSFAGAADLVEPPAPASRRGRVVADPDDLPALAQALQELCDPVAYRQCVEAIGGIADTHTTRRHVDSLLELIASVVATRTTARSANNQSATSLPVP